MAMNNLKESYAYLIFGVLTTAISLIIFQVLSAFGCDIVINNTISTVVAVLFAFFTNKVYVFKSTDWHGWYLELFKFAAARFFSYLIETCLLFILVESLHFNSFICKVFTTGVVIVMNYFTSKYAVFK